MTKKSFIDCVKSKLNEKLDYKWHPLQSKPSMRNTINYGCSKRTTMKCPNRCLIKFDKINKTAYVYWNEKKHNH